MVKREYKVGSEIWYKLGGLSETQKLQLVAIMEEDILKYRKPYDDEYFYWLITAIEEKEIDAKSFREHKDLCYTLERLTWLRQKNIHAVYSEQEDRLVKQLGQVIPKRFLQDLAEFMDMANDKRIDLEIAGNSGGNNG